MDQTFAAGAFFVLKGAFVKSKESIFFELRALGTKFAVGFMVVFAVDVDHVADGLFFTFHSFMFGVRGLRLHLNSSLKEKGSCAHKVLP
jgi:hypothetical protein